MSLVWIPKFKVGDCIKWAGYEELCIVNIKNYPEGGTYTFKNGGTMWGPSIDDGLDALEGLEGLDGLDGLDGVYSIAPATLLKKGGKSTRRKSNRRKSNRRKSTRRR